MRELKAMSTRSHKRAEGSIRERAGPEEMRRRRLALLDIVEEQQPMTVRQVFYQATVRGLIEKTENGYDKIQKTLGNMRVEGQLPWGWIVDNTRMQRKPRTYNNLMDALSHTELMYRRALWRDADAYVEIWLEKDALSGVVYPVTEKYDVPLMVARGYSSISFLYAAAEAIERQVKPAYIYHLGDFDPSGVNAGEKIEETLRKYAPDSEIHFERIAVSQAQIAAWRLPSRPTKKTDTRTKRFTQRFGNVESVELDAIAPDQLRKLVEDAITRHISAHELHIAKVAEESERVVLQAFKRFERRRVEAEERREAEMRRAA